MSDEEIKEEDKESVDKESVVESQVLTEILSEYYEEILNKCFSDEFTECEKNLHFITETSIRNKAANTLSKIMDKLYKQLNDNFNTHPVLKSPEYNLFASQVNDDINCNIEMLYQQIDLSIPILKEKLHITLNNAVDQIRETYFLTKKIKD